MGTYEVGRAQVVAGKWDEAVEWNRDLMGHLEANGWAAARMLKPLKKVKTPGSSSTFIEDDQADHMVWVWEFETVSDYEEWYAAIHADAGVKERLTRMGDLFVTEDMRFTAYQTLM